MSTWILLRGLTRETGHWGRFPEQWSETFPKARVATLELPGNGRFHALPGPGSISAMASHCRSEAMQLGLEPPFHFLALSMGAMVAVDWAERWPMEAAACVLVNTSFGTFSPLHHRMRPRAWPQLPRLLLTRDPQERERIIFRLTSRLRTDAEEIIQAWAAIRTAHPVSVGNALRQLLAAARFQAPRTAPAPTLILASAQDGLVDPRCSEIIAKRWECALACHPEAGHDLPLDDGAWIAREVRAWLRASVR